jgi:hypothetical protein
MNYQLNMSFGSYTLTGVNAPFMADLFGRVAYINFKFR